jgi:signal transduction histidine kinase
MKPETSQSTTEVPIPGSAGNDQASTGTPANLVALVTALRWATTALGLLWAVLLEPEADLIAGGALLVAYSLFRTFRPLHYGRRGLWAFVAIGTELTLTLSVIVATGCWESPYIFVLFTSVVAAGFERGIWHSLRIAGTAAITVTAASYLTNAPLDMQTLITWPGELALVACVAAFGRNLIVKAKEAEELNVTQLRRLNQANSLLVDLDRLSRDLPTSFSLKDSLDKAVDDIKATTDADAVLILLTDPDGHSFTPAHSFGIHPANRYALEDLPEAVREAATRRSITHSLPDSETIDSKSNHGIYVPLIAWSQLLGLAVVEFANQETRDRVDVRLEQLCEQLAITVDNIRWFERLQSRGAAQERLRLARELHDGVGQGVAYVAFELDRICGQDQPTDVDELIALRNNARRIVSELRETLHDLRTDVSSTQSISAVIDEFAERVERRSGIDIEFYTNAQHRLPIPQEREVWRIAQEAIVNAERHSGAKHIWVEWRLTGSLGQLVVADDGAGIETDAAPNGNGSFGIIGMRERAGIIGAHLEIRQREQGGTYIQLLIGNNERQDSGQLSSRGGDSAVD